MLDDLRDAYGSLDDPDFSFSYRRSRERPFQDVVRALGSLCALTDTTDLNDDVSQVLALGHPYNAWLYLSFSGPYAAISTASDGVVSGARFRDDLGGRAVIGVLESFGIEVLDSEVFRSTVQFGGRDATLYELLFSIDDAVR